MSPTDPAHPPADLAARRLTRAVCGLMPADGEVVGLLALMLLTEARLQPSNPDG